jgi:hypothetical protein
MTSTKRGISPIARLADDPREPGATINLVLK